MTLSSYVQVRAPVSGSAEINVKNKPKKKRQPSNSIQVCLFVLNLESVLFLTFFCARMRKQHENSIGQQCYFVVSDTGLLKRCDTHSFFNIHMIESTFDVIACTEQTDQTINSCQWDGQPCTMIIFQARVCGSNRMPVFDSVCN